MLPCCQTPGLKCLSTSFVIFAAIAVALAIILKTQGQEWSPQARQYSVIAASVSGGGAGLSAIAIILSMDNIDERELLRRSAQKRSAFGSSSSSSSSGETQSPQTGGQRALGTGSSASITTRLLLHRLLLLPCFLLLLLLLLLRSHPKSYPT